MMWSGKKLEVNKPALYNIERHFFPVFLSGPQRLYAFVVDPAFMASAESKRKGCRRLRECTSSHHTLLRIS